MNDKREGHGMYRWSNGDVYTGYWKNGKMHGRGRKEMADGSVYDGVSVVSLVTAAPCLVT